jgi:hypothetical protein
MVEEKQELKKKVLDLTVGNVGRSTHGNNSFISQKIVTVVYVKCSGILYARYCSKYDIQYDQKISHLACFE